MTGLFEYILQGKCICIRSWVNGRALWPEMACMNVFCFLKQSRQLQLALVASVTTTPWQVIRVTAISVCARNLHAILSPLTEPKVSNMTLACLLHHYHQHRGSHNQYHVAGRWHHWHNCVWSRIPWHTDIRLQWILKWRNMSDRLMKTNFLVVTLNKWISEKHNIGVSNTAYAIS